MKKSIENKKGFVMSELLAASIVILLLFSILFSNYLPLVAEFENRTLYNNVTANYGAFYVRKIYKEVLEDVSAKQTLDTGLNSQSFYTVYKYDTQDDPQLVFDENLKEQLKNIIKEYGIEEIIITKYRLDDLKGKNDLLQPYKRSDGLLYKYINYLPLYKKARSNGAQVSDLYRIILKTADFGYATTPILPEPATPVSCFVLNEYKPGEFTIVDYLSGECGTNVVVTGDEITYNGKSGRITAIGNLKNAGKGAFEGKGIERVKLSSQVKSIGPNAFKSNNITSFNFDIDAPSVTQVGADAFSDNLLTDIVIPSRLDDIGKGVFKNNYSLKSIKFNYSDSDGKRYISEDMFSLAKNSSKFKYNKIDLFIPHNIVSIGANAFKNVQFSSIKFEDSSLSNIGLRTIGNSAFEIESEVSNRSDSIDLKIPSTVESIGDRAFKNVKLSSIVLETDESNKSSLTSIGLSSFEMDEPIDQQSLTDERKLSIPINVMYIKEDAFKNQMLSEVVFEGADNLEINNLKSLEIGNEAFSGNLLKSIIIPSRLLKEESQIGSRIFGDSSLGNNPDDIVIKDEQLFNKDWCNAFYGATCTVEDQGSNDDSDETIIKVYKSEDLNTKYISCIE